MFRKAGLMVFVLLCFQMNAQRHNSNEKTFLKATENILSGNIRQAEKIGNSLLKLSLQEADDEYIAKSHYILGIVNYYDARYFIAIDHSTKALNSNYAKTDDGFTERCYNNRGTCYDNLNRNPDAIKDYQASLKITEKKRDSTSMVKTWINIALIDARINNFTNAHNLTNKALKYFDKIGDSLEVALCHQNLALFFNIQSKQERALQHAYEALHIHKAIGYDYGTVQTLCIISESYELSKNHQKSIEVLLEACETADVSKAEMTNVIITIYCDLIQIYTATNNFTLAKKYSEKVKDLYKKTGDIGGKQDYLFALSNYYAKTGDYTNFEITQGEYVNYMKKARAKEDTDHYNELKTIYDTERKETELKQQKEDIANKTKQMWWLASGIFLLLLSTSVITLYYFKMRAYAKKLYAASIQQPGAPAYTTADDSTGDKVATLYNEIIKLMQEDLLYLQPGLIIADISGQLGTNDKYVSLAINSYSGGNFNAFLNRYRMNHAKRLMAENGSSIPLKAVAIDSGFSSHTTFYRQFKEATGLTPSQFMNMSDEKLKTGGIPPEEIA